MRDDNDISPVEEKSYDDETVFRIIAGNQRGAEMSLGSGRFTLGSGEDCDIVLSDEAVEGAHLTVELDGEAVRLHALDGAVCVGELLLQPGNEAEFDVPLAVSLGNSSFAIGGAETDWTALPVPDLAAALAAEDENVSDAEAADEGALDNDEVDSEESDAEPEDGGVLPVEGEADGKTSAATGADVTEPSRIEAIVDFAKRKPAILSAAAASLVVICVAIAFSGRSDDSLAASPESPSAVVAASASDEKAASSQNAVRVLLDRANMKEVDIRQDAFGAYRLTGYVPDREAREAMHALLQDSKVSFYDRVRQVDEIGRSVEYALENYSWPSQNFEQHLIPNYVGGGVFAIDGFLGPEVDRTDLSRQIISDAPGVTRIEFKRARLSDWKAELDSELAQAGLGAWIKTQIVDGKIRVDGEVTPREANAWREVGQQFLARSRGWPKLVIAVRAAGVHSIDQPRAVFAATPAVSPLNASTLISADTDVDPSVIGVIVPKIGSGRVLLDNGGVRAVGEALFDDAVLQDVSMNKVTIQKKGKGHEYMIGGRE